MLLVLSGVILLAMVGVAVYGFVALPPDARVSVHWPPSLYSRGTPKRVGLLVVPIAGVAFEGFLIWIYAAAHPNIRTTGVVILLVAVCVLLIFQITALTAAGRNTHA